MEKDYYLEFSAEEAEIMVDVFSNYLENVNALQLKIPSIDINFKEAQFVSDSLPLLKDAVHLDIGVILQCNKCINGVLFSLAMLTIQYSKEDNDHLVTSCIVKLLHTHLFGGK